MNVVPGVSPIITDNVYQLQDATRRRQRTESGLAYKFLWHKKLTLDPGLTDAQRRIAMYCFDVSGPDGGRIFASRQTIATDLGLSINTVHTAFPLLVKTGWLLLEKKGGPGYGKKGQNNEYRLTIPPKLLLQ